MKRVKVEIWSDFVCPWCWIAKRRLEKAVLRLAEKVDVIFIPRSYRIGKGMLPSDFKSVLLQKFRNSTAAEQMMDAVAEQAAMEGLKYNFDIMQFGDTSDAHALIKNIVLPDQKLIAIERIFKAYTTDGEDIFNRDVLLSLVRDLVFPVDSVDFSSSHIATNIAMDELEANGISHGVPLFRFNGEFHLSGALSIAEFENALFRAAHETTKSADNISGESCGVGECNIGK